MIASAPRLRHRARRVLPALGGVQLAGADREIPGRRHGENAHNNFVQVGGGDSGSPGGLAFAWTIVAALLAIARGAPRRGDRLQPLTFAAVAAFAITLLAAIRCSSRKRVTRSGCWPGRPRARHSPRPVPRSLRSVRATDSAALLAAVVLTLPLRVTAAVRDTDLDHVGIGVSPIWHVSPDDRRYREAMGEATLFEPTGAFKLSVSPRTTEPVRLEISLDGRLADVVLLEPSAWNDIVIPARNVQSGERFRRMDLRTVGDAHPPLWITKDEPISPR